MTSIILYSLALILLLVSFIKDKVKTKKALKIAFTSFENIMPQFLSVIVFVGIVLAYVQPETISKLIGTSSGFLGIIFSAVIGSITLLPTFVAFSLGNTLLSSDAGYSQVAALISTLTLVGIMTFSMEAKFIGKRAAFLRNFLAFLFSFIVALFVGKVMMVI